MPGAVSQVDPAAMRQALAVITQQEGVINGLRARAIGHIVGLQWTGPAAGATALLGNEWDVRTTDIVRQLGILRDKLTVVLANYNANDETQRARATSIAGSIGNSVGSSGNSISAQINV